MHPLKLHVSKNLNMPHDISLLTEFVTAIVICVSHLSGKKFAFKKIMSPIGKSFSFRIYLAFPTGIKDLPIGI